MSDATALPPTVARVLDRFARMGREEKMQALVGFARKLEPLPERYAEIDRSAFTVPDCQTRVDLFPERRDDGTLHFYADVNARQSPTTSDGGPTVTSPSPLPVRCAVALLHGQASGAATNRARTGFSST